MKIVTLCDTLSIPIAAIALPVFPDNLPSYSVQELLTLKKAIEERFAFPVQVTPDLRLIAGQNTLVEFSRRGETFILATILPEGMY